MSLDQTKLEAFIDKFTADLAATMHSATVVLGDKLGLYRALADGGPQTPAEVAARTGCQPRLVEEWLNAQAASGYCEYHSETGQYSLTAEQAACLADESSSTFIAGGMLAAAASHKAEERVRSALAGDGAVGWHEQHADLFTGTDRFFRPRYDANVVNAWIPALDGVEEKLRAGARVADVGCGFGALAVLLAKAYPTSTFHGFDYHADSIAAARKAAAVARVSDRVTFEVALADEFPGNGYDLICVCNTLHELGDPVRAARRIRKALKPDGTWLLVEPRAGDRVEDKLNMVGRIFYSTSTLICVPNALSQGAPRALGAQVGEAVLRQVATEAGFSRVRCATKTPFNLVLEARP